MEMDQAQALEHILDHFEHPRNHGAMEAADITYQGQNPGCGDTVTVYLKFKGERLEAISYTAAGCTISQAAASMITELAPQYSLDELENLDFHLMEDLLGEKLVRNRPKCSTLGLDTLKNAARQYRQRKV